MTTSAYVKVDATVNAINLFDFLDQVRFLLTPFSTVDSG